MDNKREQAGVNYTIFIPEELLIKLLTLAEDQGVSSKEYLIAMIDANIQMAWLLRD